MVKTSHDLTGGRSPCEVCSASASVGFFGFFFFFLFNDLTSFETRSRCQSAG